MSRIREQQSAEYRKLRDELPDGRGDWMPRHFYDE